MTILVTGGTGLLGSRLLPRLLAAGVDCRALARRGGDLPSGAAAFEGDLLDPESLKSATAGVSAIIHLAATLRTPDAADIWRTNLEGTQNLIAAAKEHAPNARFIMMSTGLVYRADGSRPALEGDEAAPQTPYPASKIAAEKALRESGLNWVILRLGFVYGDGDGHLQAVRGLADRLGWHPASRLSLIHHRDIETAVNLAMSGVMDGRIVNIVDDAPTTILEITTLLGDPVPQPSDPLTNPWFGHLDGSLARQLGFEPQVTTVHRSLREGTV